MESPYLDRLDREERAVVIYTCVNCRHLSPYRSGTNGHRHHCPGAGMINTDDLNVIRAAFRLGGLDAVRELIDSLNYERVGYSLPGPL